METIPVIHGAREASADALERFPRVLAEGRFRDLKALLTADVRLRALIPRGPEQREGCEAVVERFQDWFSRGQPIHAEDITVRPSADRWLLAYTFTVGAGPQRQVVTQQCVCDVEDGQISAIDLVCSGFRPHPSASAEIRRFDAGDLGCGDGLAQEFRRQMNAMPLGGVLEVLTRDPAAREDLPPLARLMGHAVHDVQTLADGRVAITVERIK